MPSQMQRQVTIAAGLALGACIVLIVCEYYLHTRLQSFYVSSREFGQSSYYLLVGERQRGELVVVPGKGYHSAAPGRSKAEVVASLRARYPNDFDENKLVWVLKDEEGAFYYRLKPNWLAAVVLFVMLTSLFSWMCRRSKRPRFGSAL